jgi:GT2 family glycosyltransferase
MTGSTDSTAGMAGAPTEPAAGVSTDTPAPTPGVSVDPASISVVVPTYNDVGRIGDALHSILAQTAAPGEIVVCDDGSDDGTEQYVQRLATQRAGAVEIRYVPLARSGVVAARNAGIAAARGRWIAECDSDDTWAPVKLERQIAFLRTWRGERRVAMVGTHGCNMNDAKRVISPATMGPVSERDYEELRASGGLFYLIHSSVLFAREDFEAIGGYSTEYGAADEFDFYGRMAERGVVLNLPESLVYYRKRAGSMQLERFWDKQRGAWRVAENQRRRLRGEPPLGREEFAAQLAAAPAWERLRRRRKTLGMYCYRAGSAQIVNGQRVRGGGRLLAAAVLDTGRLRAGVLGAVRGRWRRTAPAAAYGPSAPIGTTAIPSSRRWP